MEKIRLNKYRFQTCIQHAQFLTIVFSGFLACGIFIIVNFKNIQAKAPENAFAGEWIAEIKSGDSNKIDVKFKRQFTKEGFSSTTNPFRVNELQGFPAQTGFSQKTKVNFRIVREAGTFECEGYMQDEKGTGLWKLTINQDYISSMHNRGFDNLTENDLFDAVLQNINSKLIQDLESAGYDHLSFHDLVEARIFNITTEFIHEQKSAGYGNLAFKELVELRLFNKISKQAH